MGRLKWRTRYPDHFLQTPLNNEKIGLGLSVINDKAGYEKYTYVYADFSYTVDVSDDVTLAFGLKAGASYYDLDEDLFTEPSILNDPFLTINLIIGLQILGQSLFILSKLVYGTFCSKNN